VVKDATASLSEEEMHAALDINLRNYVNAIVTTSEIVEAISSLGESVRLADPRHPVTASCDAGRMSSKTR
jgi:hypothetical protein